jgi:isochorismate synthase EntC
MSLFNCGVPRSEAEMMVRRKEAFEKELFNNFGGNG